MAEDRVREAGSGRVRLAVGFRDSIRDRSCGSGSTRYSRFFFLLFALLLIDGRIFFIFNIF